MENREEVATEENREEVATEENKESERAKDDSQVWKEVKKRSNHPCFC